MGRFIHGHLSEKYQVNRKALVGTFEVTTRKTFETLPGVLKFL